MIIKVIKLLNLLFSIIKKIRIKPKKKKKKKYI